MRLGLALAVPVVTAVLIGTFTDGFADGGNRAPVLGALGLAAWFVGLNLYGLPALGLKGGRPLFASIGFATLGWVTFVVLRALLIPIKPEVAGSTRAFTYYLLFEAFAVQLWTFGLLFRAVADWRGPLTAAIVSGLVFAGTAVLLFQNAYANQPFALIYFVAWGIFYGIIRLRTGSILGTVLIQALQTFTAWVALGPLPPGTPPSQLLWLYGLSAVCFALFTWRLWPKVESDYRV
jgi:hypothetical protein